MQRVANLQLRDVHNHVLGDLHRQAAQLHLIEQVFQDSVIALHTHRGTLDLDGHLDDDQLGQRNVLKIDVEQIQLNRMKLDLLDQRLEGLSVLASNGDVDHAVARTCVQELPKLVTVRCHGHRLSIVPVKHARHPTQGAQPPSGALASLLPELHFQNHLRHSHALQSTRAKTSFRARGVLRHPDPPERCPLTPPTHEPSTGWGGRTRTSIAGSKVLCLANLTTPHLLGAMRHLPAARRK